MNLNEMIELAIAAGACDIHIKTVRKFDTFEELKKDRRAPYWLCWYAVNVIHGRFSEAEEVIKKDRWYAYLYSTKAIQRPWPEAEEIIRSDPDIAYYYDSLFSVDVDK